MKTTLLKAGSFRVFSDKVFEGVGGGGKLMPIEFSGLPFIPKRVFTVSGVHEMELRGNHAHMVNQQILVCVAGSITVYLQRTDEDGERQYNLEPGDWVYHPNMEWCSLEFRGRESVMLSLCSHEYDPSDYISSFEELEDKACSKMY